jgi:hypothetical protein
MVAATRLLKSFTSVRVSKRTSSAPALWRISASTFGMPSTYRATQSDGLFSENGQSSMTFMRLACAFALMTLDISAGGFATANCAPHEGPSAAIRHAPMVNTAEADKSYDI